MLFENSNMRVLEMLMPCCGCWISPIGSILIPSLSFMLTPAKYLVCLMEQLVVRVKVHIHKSKLDGIISYQNQSSNPQIGGEAAKDHP